MTQFDTKKPMFGRGRFANRPYNGLILHSFPFQLRNSCIDKIATRSRLIVVF